VLLSAIAVQDGEHLGIHVGGWVLPLGFRVFKLPDIQWGPDTLRDYSVTTDREEWMRSVMADEVVYAGHRACVGNPKYLWNPPNFTSNPFYGGSNPARGAYGLDI
jgi:hypothetical protein